MPGLSSILPALHRRSSSIRERIRTLSIRSSTSTNTTESYKPYSVYHQAAATMPIPPAISILDSSEVTQKILEALLDLPNGRRALSRLARTCHAWMDPTLDILWRELDSLVPILGLFPGSLLKKAKKPGLGFAAAPTDKDWDKVLKYGPKVQKITYDELLNNVSNTVFPVFEEFRPKTHILPNLRQLTWKVLAAENLDRAGLFLTPELQHLVLHLNGAGVKYPTLPTFLADLGSRMRLESLSIVSSVALPENVTHLLMPQRGLEKLSITAPSTLVPSMGKWIAYLPNLQSLQLDLSGKSSVVVGGFFRDLGSGASTPESIESHTDSGVFSGEEADFSEIRRSLLKLTGDTRSHRAFAELRQLQLTGSAAAINAFISRLSASVSSLELIIEDPPSARDWQELSAMIGDRFGSSLVTLRIGATASSRFSDLVRSTSRVAPAPSRLSLMRLSALPALRTLSIDLPESICFTAKDIAKLASVAPGLEDIRLCPLSRFTATYPPQLTLQDLTPLLKDCKRLTSLSVVINAKGGGVDPKVSSASLRWFHIGNSWITDTFQVAILLSQLAPYLETIKWFMERNRPGFNEANARGWQKVSDILPYLQDLRLSERRAAMPEREVIVEYVEVEAARPQTVDKGVDATVSTMDCAIEARPSTVEFSIQAEPSTREFQIQATPSLVSIGIGAIPETSDAEVDAAVAPVQLHSMEIQTVDEGFQLSSRPNHYYHPIASLSPLSSLMSLAGIVGIIRFLVSYPLGIPVRILHSILGLVKWERIDSRPAPETVDVALDDINVRT